MSDGRTPEERRLLGLPDEAVAPTAAEADRARRTVDALERLRAQLLHTQGVLDQYLEQLDARPDDAHTTTSGG